MAISEAELILPSLYLISLTSNGELSTTELISELRNLIKPLGDDLEILKGRKDDKFSQKVRNLVSHGTLQKIGYAIYDKGSFSLTKEGYEYLNEDENSEVIKEKFLQDYEGIETIQQISKSDSFNEIGENISAIYPQTALNIERTLFSIFELKRKKDNGKLILDPDFQRNDVWKRTQKAELIESILMNIPLPFIYLTENSKGELVVVDGRQRLTALFEFIDNEYSLGNKLAILGKLKNKKFKGLDPFLQGIIEDYQLTTHIIKPPIPDRVLIDIFDRVNRGGTSLTNQEIRNALYQGKSTVLLKRLAQSEDFKIATDHSIKEDRMKDKYLILRFLSFYIWRKGKIEKDFSRSSEYKGDPEQFLANQMQYINEMDDSIILKLENTFHVAMINTFNILGNDAFRLPSKKEAKIKRPVNMALFEVISYLMSHSELESKKQIVIDEYKALITDFEFIKSFLSIDGTIKYRFEKIDEIINRVKHA